MEFCFGISVGTLIDMKWNIGFSVSDLKGSYSKDIV